MTAKTSRRKPHPYDAFTVRDSEGFRCLNTAAFKQATHPDNARHFLEFTAFGRPSATVNAKALAYRMPQARLLLAYGTRMNKHAFALADAPLMDEGECWANALRTYFGNLTFKGFGYAEGLGVTSRGAYLHAWNTVGKLVHDRTWHHRCGLNSYLGIIFDDAFIRYMEFHTGLCCGFLSEPCFPRAAVYVENYARDRQRKFR